MRQFRIQPVYLPGSNRYICYIQQRLNALLPIIVKTEVKQ